MMRILVDTNILISAILLPNSNVAKTLLKIAKSEQMVLCDKNIEEFREVICRKVPDKLLNVDIILTGDKDFLALDMEHPRCMNIKQFLEEMA